MPQAQLLLVLFLCAHRLRAVAQGSGRSDMRSTARAGEGEGGRGRGRHATQPGRAHTRVGRVWAVHTPAWAVWAVHTPAWAVPCRVWALLGPPPHAAHRAVHPTAAALPPPPPRGHGSLCARASGLRPVTDARRSADSSSRVSASVSCGAAERAGRRGTRAFRVDARRQPLRCGARGPAPPAPFTQPSQPAPPAPSTPQPHLQPRARLHERLAGACAAVQPRGRHARRAQGRPRAAGRGDGPLRRASPARGSHPQARGAQGQDWAGHDARAACRPLLAAPARPPTALQPPHPPPRGVGISGRGALGSAGSGAPLGGSGGSCGP